MTRYARTLAAPTLLAALVAVAGGGPAMAQSSALADTAQACFDEKGLTYCAALKLACPGGDDGCLLDDLSGAILRARNDNTARYAAYMARALIARRGMQLADAMADLEAAAAIQPRLATPHVLRAHILADLGRHADALASLDAAEQRAPRVPVILLARARLRLHLGAAAAAITELDLAIQVTRGGEPVAEGGEVPLAELLAARGAAWLAVGQHGRARADADHALRLEPGHVEANRLMSRLLAGE